MTKTMKVAVSHESAKGNAKGDFHWTEDGEILTLPAIICEGPKVHRDRCGCGRAFSGLSSLRSCTTAIVEERDESEVMKLAAEACVSAGWGADLIDAYQGDVKSLSMALYDCKLGSLVRIESSPKSFRIAEVVKA